VTWLGPLLVCAAVVLAMRDWRMGLYASTAVGFLQDPLRKLVPDQPVTYTVLVVVVFAACVLGALLRGELPRLGEVFRWYPNLRAPVALFATLVLLQSLRTLLVSRSLVLAGLGVLSYLSPVVAIVLGQRLFASPDAFARWLRFYLLATTVVTATVFAQFFGTSNTLFASIGLDTVYGVGGRIQMMCGVMRSSEIAAWHIGIGACVALTFSTTAVRVRSRLVYSFVAAVSLLAVFLTGRRKMLAEFALFLLCYLLLLLRHQQGATRIVRFAAVGALGLVAAASYLIATGREDRLLPYLSRGVSVIQESEQRLSGMTVSQFGWVVESNGFLGSGAGTGAQGSQYFGGGTAYVGGGAEGGAAKVLAELGVPGALAALWLAAALGGCIFRTARFGTAANASTARLFYGIGSLFPANAAVFVTAHQVFGDPFVVILIGLMLGAFFALPRHVYLEAAAGSRQPQSALKGTVLSPA